MDAIAQVIDSFHRKGVRLWSEKGQLRYSGPKGVLTSADVETLRHSKTQIISMLEESARLSRREPVLVPRPKPAIAPLAFSQLAHWNLYQLATRAAIRTVCSATRLAGPLNLTALRDSLSDLVRRHSALRTRIAVHNGVAIQVITETERCEPEIVDLTRVPAAHRAGEVVRHIEKLILQPIDVGGEPLFSAQFLKLDAQEHVLILVMEHMIADGFSLGIVTRDLFTRYESTVNGRAIELPALPMQFADYAYWQRVLQAGWFEEQIPNWNARLQGSGRLRFPQDVYVADGAHLGRGTVEIRITRELRSELLEWCRLRRTTLVMSLFTAYVALVMRWCDGQDAVFQYQTNSRFHPAIENTVGYFASVLYLRMRLSATDCFSDLLKRATAEYCEAYDHADFGYQAAQIPRPEFTRNTVFNWIPRSSPDVLCAAPDEVRHTLQYSPVRFTFPAPPDFELDREPFVIFADSGADIVADVYFALSRFSRPAMEKFARNMLVFLRAMMKQHESRIVDLRMI